MFVAFVFFLTHQVEGSGQPAVLNRPPQRCEFSLKALKARNEWHGEVDLIVQSSKGQDLSVHRIPEFQGPAGREHFRIVDPAQTNRDELGYVMVDAVPRGEGKSGYAYRVVTYSALDPKAVQEGFLVLPNGQARLRESVVLPVTDYEPNSSDVYIEVLDRLEELVPDAVTSSVVTLTTYGKSSASAALSSALYQYRLDQDYESLPKEISEDDLYEMAGENFDFASSFPVLLTRFKSAYSSREIRSGKYGDFEEAWFVADGHIKFKDTTKPMRTFFHVMRMGPMSYVHVFEIERAGDKQKSSNSKSDGSD
jgi:hypothetical protein